MTYQVVLLLISFVIFATYWLFIYWKYGLQESISESFYAIKRRNPYQPWKQGFFTLALWGFSFPIIVVGVEIHPLFFLAGALICLVGAAPAFKSTKMVHDVHAVGAIGGIVFGIVAFLFVNPILAAYTLASILLTSIFANEENHTLWIETVAYLSVIGCLFSLTI